MAGPKVHGPCSNPSPDSLHAWDGAGDGPGCPKPNPGGPRVSRAPLTLRTTPWGGPKSAEGGCTRAVREGEREGRHRGARPACRRAVGARTWRAAIEVLQVLPPGTRHGGPELPGSRSDEGHPARVPWCCGFPGSGLGHRRILGVCPPAPWRPHIPLAQTWGTKNGSQHQRAQANNQRCGLLGSMTARTKGPLLCQHQRSQANSQKKRQPAPKAPCGASTKGGLHSRRQVQGERTTWDPSLQ